MSDVERSRPFLGAKRGMPGYFAGRRKTIKKRYPGKVPRPFKRTSYDGIYYAKICTVADVV